MATRPYNHSKRLIDLLVGTVLLVVMAPILLLIALAIVVDSGLPVFFNQIRVGREGRHFKMYKFRSLYFTDHDPSAPDDVATWVGRFIRRWALDELPQLWNVVRGEMSIVGPRPTIPEQVEQYTDFQRRRLEVKPGLTGYAQVHGRNSLSWDERIAHDVWYVDHAGLGLDLRIMARTPLVLLSGEGVYGESGRNDPFSDSRPARPDESSP